MDKKEFSTFAMALKTYYPRENLLPNQYAMELWFRELCDIHYEVAEMALRKWVSTSKWSPSIADIREVAATISNGNIPDWGHGWEQVIKAIGRYGYYNADEAMNSFDEITRECVKRLGFKNLCMSENQTADRASFRMIYEQVAERKRMNVQLPGNLRKLLAERLDGPLMIEAEGGNKS